MRTQTVAQPKWRDRQYIQVQEEAPPVEYVPDAQLLQEEAPAPEYLPAGQLVQAAAPPVEYLPAAHFVQDFWHREGPY